MRKIVTEGVICLKDDYGLIYKVSDIIYEELEDCNYKYIFRPCYNVINLLSSYLFQGIPGLNLDLKLDCYVRENIIPVFISERTPGENREDLQELLAKCGMKHLNRLEWLIKTDTQYFGDRLFVIEKTNYPNPIEVNSMFDLVERFDSINKKLLDIICYGLNLNCKEVKINDNNRLEYYNLLLPIYQKYYESRMKRLTKGIKRAVEENSFKGRKAKFIDPNIFKIVVTDYKNKNISLEDALEKLDVSKSTFFRRMRELNL